MILKQGDMVVLHPDNIINIHDKLGFNIYIDNYFSVIFLSGINQYPLIFQISRILKPWLLGRVGWLIFYLLLW